MKKVWNEKVDIQNNEKFDYFNKIWYNYDLNCWDFVSGNNELCCRNV